MTTTKERQLNKPVLHQLFDVAVERRDPVERREIILGIIDTVLFGLDDSEPGAPRPERAPLMEALTAAVEARETQAAPPSRGQSAGKPAPKDSSPSAKGGGDVLQLLDHFGVDERRRHILIALAKEAVEKGGGMGLPSYEDPNTYRMRRRGGPPPHKLVYQIDGERYELTPPIISEGKNGVHNEISCEFERHLLGIEEVKEPDQKRAERQMEISMLPGVQRRHLEWTEGVPSERQKGVPLIAAETARSILRKNVEFMQRLGDSIDHAPGSWITPQATWNDKVSAFMRDVVLGKVAFGRADRFAIARLIKEPLFLIEREIFRMGFPDKNLQEKLHPGYKSQKKAS